MKKTAFLDVFVVSGFITGFFYGFLNPLYISMILSRLDGRIIALGSFMSSAFPVLVGALLGSRRVSARLYAILPVVMVLELAAAAGAALVAFFDIVAYYLVSMFVLGVFSSCVVYLLQKIKESRYRRNRAAFDRRCDMADALGLVLGSALSLVGMGFLTNPRAVALAGCAQTAVVYGLFLILYRKVPTRRERRADEEAHPCAPRLSMLPIAA